MPCCVLCALPLIACRRSNDCGALRVYGVRLADAELMRGGIGCGLWLCSLVTGSGLSAAGASAPGAAHAAHGRRQAFGVVRRLAYYARPAHGTFAVCSWHFRAIARLSPLA